MTLKELLEKNAILEKNARIKRERELAQKAKEEAELEKNKKVVEEVVPEAEKVEEPVLPEPENQEEDKAPKKRKGKKPENRSYMVVENIEEPNNQ